MMNKTIKNTSFDNLVNYQTLFSNSSVEMGAFMTSSDPTSLASVIQNHQIVSYNLVEQVEKTVLEKNNIELT